MRDIKISQESMTVDALLMVTTYILNHHEV